MTNVGSMADIGQIVETDSPYHLIEVEPSVDKISEGKVIS